MSVKVVRERSDQRRHHRVTAPLFVTFGGHRIKAADWSLGGLRLEGYPGELPAIGATAALEIAIPFQGFDVNFKCEAEVVRRVGESRTLAFKFTQIGERELGLMEHFIDELIRGSMVDIKDTIQRIDVPVTPASTKPDPNPLSKVPISRWPTKTIAFATFYLTIGLFVFGYAAVIAYTNFVRMEVDSAVIASPLESVRSQVNGRIIYGKYRQGDPVPKGAMLLSVVDNDLERQIDLATIDIKEKTAQLAANERQLVEELARVDAFSKVEDKNLDQIDLEVQSMQAQAKAAASQYQRLNHLFKQGLTTATQVENAEKQMISAQKLAEAKSVELQTRRSLASYNAGSRLYNGQSFMGDRAKIEAQVFLAREHVSVAERKLQALLDHRDRLAVYAPYAGVLQELPRADGSMVRVGDVLAVVENPKAREIWAFLRQDEVLSVGLGDEVSVYLPGLSELRKAKVMRIDRTIGFVNEMNSTYIWRAPRDRSAKVVLEFIDNGTRPHDDSYRTGMPAVAIFSTRPTNYLIGDMMHRFRMVFGGRPRKPAQDVAAAEDARKKAARERPTDSHEGAGAARNDRLGPPRSYEASGDPLRDPDAVTARRTAVAANSVPPADVASEAASAPAAAGVEAKPGLVDQVATGAAALGTQLRAMFARKELPATNRPEPARQIATPLPGATPPTPSSAIPPLEPPTPRQPEATASSPPAPQRPKRFREDDATPPPPPPTAGTEQSPRAGNAETPLRRARPEPPSAPVAQGIPVPPRVSAPPPRTSPMTAPRNAPGPDDADREVDDDERPLRHAERPSGAARPATSASSTPSSHGFFARMKERLQNLFVIKPEEDDDDWSEEEAAVARPEPEGRNAPATPSRPKAGKPVDAIEDPLSGPQPPTVTSPRLPSRPVAPPPQPRRPTTAMLTVPHTATLPLQPRSGARRDRPAGTAP